MVAFTPTIRIQTQAFDAQAESALLRAGSRAIGALVSFEGICRDHNRLDGESGAGEVVELELEHYPGMTEASIASMVEQASRRWPLQGVTVIHRIGLLHPADPIVLVVVASAHRQAALEACAFLMDYLKTQAPLWKKETGADGRSHWVDAREADDHALERWGLSVPGNSRGG